MRMRREASEPRLARGWPDKTDARTGKKTSCILRGQGQSIWKAATIKLRRYRRVGDLDAPGFFFQEARQYV